MSCYGGGRFLPDFVSVQVQSFDLLSTTLSLDKAFMSFKIFLLTLKSCLSFAVKFKCIKLVVHISNLTLLCLQMQVNPGSFEH